MKNKTHRQPLAAMAALLLTLSLLAGLTGCRSKTASAPERTQKAQTALKVQKPEASAQSDPAAEQKPEKKQSPHSGKTEVAAQTDTQAGFSAAGTAALAALRTQLDTANGSDLQFAVAYLGYVGGLFDEGFETGFPAWLAEIAPRQLEQNPFLREIDESHIIGSAGHLYCIVPHDANASVAVNRIHWDPEAMDYVQDEVIYRMESGEPLLLFANLDGNEYAADTEVVIVSENGQSCIWYPTRDMEDKVALAWDKSGGPCALDFTAYADVSVGEFGDWLVNGWLGPTALGLAGAADMGGQMWTAGAMTQDGRSAYFTLTFYPGDETGGQVDLNWYYDGQGEYEEMWSGFWTIRTEPEQPSYVTLDLSRVGGANYDTVDGPYYFSETYPLLLAPSGESLIVAAGDHGIALPGMADSMLYIEFLLALG